MDVLRNSREVLELRKVWENDKSKALVMLRFWQRRKITLPRPVFFVPGWTDEANEAWMKSYSKAHRSIRAWFDNICYNPENIHYIQYSNEESMRSQTFFDFGNILREKILSILKKREMIDIVAHSMGGLAAMAALSQERSIRFRVRNLVTAATPHRGTEWGELLASFVGRLFTDYASHHKIQGKSMDPDQIWIQKINQISWRRRLLRRICHLYCLTGSRDMAVMSGSRFDVSGLSKELQSRVHILEYGGVKHSGKDGISADPRVMVDILMILADCY